MVRWRTDEKRKPTSGSAAIPPAGLSRQHTHPTFTGLSLGSSTHNRALPVLPSTNTAISVSLLVCTSLTSSTKHIFSRKGSFRPIFFLPQLSSDLGTLRTPVTHPLLTAVTVSGRHQASSCRGTVCYSGTDFPRASSSQSCKNMELIFSVMRRLHSGQVCIFRQLSSQVYPKRGFV